MMTNLYKTRENIIYELVLSLNKGSSGVLDSRVDTAIQQYNSMVKKGIIVEKDEDDEEDGCYEKDLAKVCDELHEMQELLIRLQDDRLEKEIEESMRCNHEWNYLDEDGTYATCSKCGVVRTV